MSPFQTPLVTKQDTEPDLIPSSKVKGPWSPPASLPAQETVARLSHAGRVQQHRATGLAHRRDVFPHQTRHMKLPPLPLPRSRQSCSELLTLRGLNAQAAGERGRSSYTKRQQYILPFKHPLCTSDTMSSEYLLRQSNRSFF